MKIASHTLLVAISTIVWLQVAHAGVIKDLYNKLTHTNNKTEDTVKQSAPICGSGLFSTPNENSLSPEIIFITNRPSKSVSVNEGREQYESYNRDSNPKQDQTRSREVSKEFRFHGENVTLEELRSQGFNPNAPTTFLMHGFTSGYPLQAWISAIVEAYSIDRESNSGSSNNNNDYNSNQGSNGEYERSRDRERRPSAGRQSGHNLFIVNWHYAARGIVYPRAVANIPIVASYVTRFINNKLIDEARVDPNRIQLIGHSLGAHLAGFIGKNTKSKLGRIYGLDPAGPCFGAISGPLYPSSKRLAPSDASEVITIHTNTALLGIDKPLGRYSVYVEGGSVQPGCKGGKVFSSVETLTLDGGSFDTVACSHSRAPNLLTYRHDQSDDDDDCQLVAYECENWDSFVAGHCGSCTTNTGQSQYGRDESSIRPVECLRIGLDWQYPGKESPGNQRPQGERPSSAQFNGRETTRRPYDDFNNDKYTSTRRPSSNYGGNDRENGYSNNDRYTSTRRPTSNLDDRENGYQNYGYQNSTYSNQNQRQTSTRRPPIDYDREDQYSGSNSGQQKTSTRRPYSENTSYQPSSYNNNNSNQGRTSTYRPTDYSYSRERREVRRNETEPTQERRREDSSVEAKTLFLRTGDTQPYCTFHYQVILELNEPFQKKKPPISLLLQDSEPDNNSRRPSSSRKSENSLSSDEFGNRFNDRTYTQLLTSGRKLHRIDHATLLFREGLQDGHRVLKSLRVNYMSNANPNVRQRLSSHLCPVKTNANQNQPQSNSDSGGNRFFFEPCGAQSSSSSGSSTHSQETNYGNSPNRRPSQNYNNNS